MSKEVKERNQSPMSMQCFVGTISWLQLVGSRYFFFILSTFYFNLAGMKFRITFVLPTGKTADITFRYMTIYWRVVVVGSIISYSYNFVPPAPERDALWSKFSLLRNFLY